MPHPLEHKLAKMRRRVRLLAAVYGLSAILSIVTAAAILLGLTDYLLQFQDRGVRVLASLALLGASAWACYRYFYLPAVFRLRDVDLATKLQRRFPLLEDRLLSAVEFIARDNDDPTAGSAALRRSVIAQVTAETEDIDFNQAVDPSPTVRALLLLLVIFSVAGTLATLDLDTSQTAISRLINPLGNAAWPQKNHLIIRQPVDRVGRGQAFEIEAFDSAGARLPSEVYIHYQYADANGVSTEESELMHQVGKTAVARRENVIRPFSYRVEGGDDRGMAWMPVKVVDPPAVESLSIRLLPPSYTGWPAQKSENNIRALVGTRLEIEAKATKPLRTAVLCLEDGRELTGRLSVDGLRVSLNEAGLIVEQSGSYWFRLTDREGLSGGENDRWEITAVADQPPIVTIEQPATNLYVTPDAVVPLKIEVKDDLAIRDVVLAFQQTTSNNSENIVPLQETVVPLYVSAQKTEFYSFSREPEASVENVAGRVPNGRSQSPHSDLREVIEYRWELDQLGLAPGRQVVFQAVASDNMPQTTRSDPRRLIVVTQREIEDRIAARQNLLLSEIDRVLKMQRAGRGQLEAAAIRMAGNKQPEQSDLDRLRSVELGQRQVGTVLTGRGEGVPSHVFAMLDDLEINRVENPDLKRRLELVLEEIDRLERDNLPIIGRELTSAVKSMEIVLAESPAPGKIGPESAAALAAAGKNQDQVVRTLENLLAQFAQSDSSQRFYRDLSQLLREQEDTAQRTAGLGGRTLGKQLKDLTPQDAEDLRNLASRQFDHSRSLDRTVHKIRQSVAELLQSDPAAAKMLALALDEIFRAGIGGQMLSCGDNLRQNQIGQAAEQHKSIIENLRQIIERLTNQNTRLSDPDQLTRLENVVKDLLERQKYVLEKTLNMEQTRQSQGQLNRAQSAALLDLAHLQRALQIDAERLAGQTSPTAAFALAIDGAGRDMLQAAGLLDRRLTGAETQQTQQNAVRRLNMILDALQPEPLSNQSDTATNDINKTPDNARQPGDQSQNTISLSELKMLKMLQEEINRRTITLAETIGPDGKPTDTQRREYEELAKEQSRLAELILKMMDAN